MSEIGWLCLMGFFALWTGIAFWWGFRRGKARRPHLRLMQP